MLLTFLKCKLHHARVTHCQVDYQGSVGISRNLMNAIGLLEGEQVHIWAVDHIARCITYVIPVDENGIIALKGGIAQQFAVGDRVVIAAFALAETAITPQTAILDEHNKIIST